MRNIPLSALFLLLAIGESVLAGNGVPIRVACVGDSITEGAGTAPGRSYPNQLQEMLGDKWLVKNFGIGGRTLLRKGDMPYWNETIFQDACTFQPDIVVIMLGTNDLKPGNWVHGEEFAADYLDLVEVFQKLESHPGVFLCTPCPIPDPGNHGINEAALEKEIPLIRNLARKKGLRIIDVHSALKLHPELLPDRIHPNSDGATIIAETVGRAISSPGSP